MGKSTRREFLKQMALTGAAISGLPALGTAQEGAKPSAKPRVVVVKDANSLNKSGDLSGAVVRDMVNKSVVKLTGAKDAKSAWKQMFSPDDVVGIKVNCLFGKGVATHPEVAMAVAGGLALAGVKRENIIIWDRSTRDLLKSGYAPNTDGADIKCCADDDDWGEEIESGAFKGRLSKIITERVTAFVNVPILKTHGLTGISCCLKNHYGSFDNPGSHHKNHANPAIADFNSLPIIRAKERLVVVDAIRPQCDGGPGLKADAQFDYHAILASKDPLAADAFGVDVIQKQRSKTGLKPIGDNVLAWMQSAKDRGVGECDLDKIEIVTA